MQLRMHSQSDFTIVQQALSPHVQLMHTPSLVVSQRQWQQVKLHWQIVTPFHVQATQQAPPASARQRFCSVRHDTSSSQAQRILQPSAHCSQSIWQRGTKQPVEAAGTGATAAVEPGQLAVVAQKPERSVNIALVITKLLWRVSEPLVKPISARKNVGSASRCSGQSL